MKNKLTMNADIEVELSVHYEYGSKFYKAYRKDRVFIPLKRVPYKVWTTSDKYHTQYTLDSDFVEKHVDKFLHGLKYKWWRFRLPEKYYLIYDQLDLDYDVKILRVYYEIL